MSPKWKMRRNFPSRGSLSSTYDVILHALQYKAFGLAKSGGLNSQTLRKGHATTNFTGTQDCTIASVTAWQVALLPECVKLQSVA